MNEQVNREARRTGRAGKSSPAKRSHVLVTQEFSRRQHDHRMRRKMSTPPRNRPNPASTSPKSADANERRSPKRYLHAANRPISPSRKKGSGRGTLRGKAPPRLRDARGQQSSQPCRREQASTDGCARKSGLGCSTCTPGEKKRLRGYSHCNSEVELGRMLLSEKGDGNRVW